MQEALIAEITRNMEATVGRPLSQPALEALRATPRHEFVPEEIQSLAYINRPLPIGRQQTISQPFIVALMTEVLALDGCQRVLEIGTGSGYQAAVLAHLCQEVYTVEIIEELATAAKGRLARLGYANVTVKHGDGMQGWQEKAPFDAIMVTAAGLEIPEALLEQLKPGGALVMPVGPQGQTQQLQLIQKRPEGYAKTNVLPVIFVPITQEIR